MADQASNDKLAGFLALAKNARGRAAASIIADATATPGLYAFGELLDLVHIKELEGTEHAASLQLLRLFAFGTLSDYKAAAAALPPLSPAQLLKLKQLTVVEMACSRKLLPYAELAAALDVSEEGGVRELEDFVINECFSTELVKGKLDQQRGCVEVHWALGRDIKPGQLQAMAAQLANWHATCEGALASLAARVAQGAALSAAAAAEDVVRAAALAEAKKAAAAEAEARCAAATGAAAAEEAYYAGGALGEMAGSGYAQHDTDRTRPKRRR